MKTITSLLTKCSVLFVFGVLLSTSEAQAQLFKSVTVAEADSVMKVDSDILKRRVVKVNFSEAARQTRVGGKLALNLFEDLDLKATVKRVEDRGPQNYTLSGNLDGEDFSTFALAAVGDAVAIDVRRGNGELYQVRFVQNGLHEICQVDESKVPQCGVKPEHVVQPPPFAADEPPQSKMDTADVIDLMVVYTPAARNAAGSSNAIHSQINLAISGANTAFAESQINTSLRLVYAGEIAYTESTMSTDLSRITNPGDSHMDVVHSLRNTYGADMVSLWRTADGTSCGVAWVMQSLHASFESSAFSVVAVGNCAGANLSFAHELAHNMGCTHNREDSGGQGLYSYSYGWRFTGTNTVNYRTIMAYNGTPSSSRIPRFSNPSVSYFGTPTGVAVGQPNEAHNAQTINNAALTVANFRQTIFDPGIIGHPQPQKVALGTTATFTVTASGTAPFHYYWRRSGTNIGGASTSSSYSITNVQLSDATIYSVLVSNSVGTILSSNASLTIDDFGTAVDNTGFSWSKSGNADWITQTAITQDGVDAVESGPIANFGVTVFETPIVGPGTLSFWWKVSSELGYDFLDPVFNGTALEIYGISGEVDWNFMSFEIPPGNHTWGWKYSKDSSFSSGMDRGWVDQVLYVAGSSFHVGSWGKTNGQYKFIWNGRAGGTYTLEASTNLINWAALTNVNINNPTNLFIDAGSIGLSNRFYRIKSP